MARAKIPTPSIDVECDEESSISASIGTYQLIAEIARGGMARVCLCRRAGEAGFQRLFALKLMHPHLATEEEFVQMLLDEAHLAARINHPNVVSTVDLGRYEGGYYLVMDYVEGASLWELLTRSKHERKPSLLIPIALDALRGLTAAHTQTDEDGTPLGIVHRDVSPHNVLVGIDGLARITDFGIAKATGRISSTRPGIRKGKFEYMAPEQILSGQCDARTDVFSFGVLLWNALTGERLFRGETDAGTLHNVLNRAIPPPSTVGLKPPAWLDAPILRALERDPDARYASADDLARELRREAAAHGAIASRDEVGAWVHDVFEDQLRVRRELIATTRRESRTPVAMVVRGELQVAEASTLPRLVSLAPKGLTKSESARTIALPLRPHRHALRWAVGLISGAVTATLLTTGLVALLLADDRVEPPKIRKPAPVVPAVEIIPIPTPAPAPAIVPDPPAKTQRRARRARPRSALERMDQNPYLLTE